MIAVSIRYVYSRHLFASIQDPSSVLNSTATAHTSQLAGGKLRVDKTLLFRFAILFVIISAFEVSLISCEFMRRANAHQLAQQGHPDFTVSSTISEILEFIPGVTAGLLAFLIFGTTAHSRKKYAEAFKAVRGWRRRPSPVKHDGNMEFWNTLGSELTVGGFDRTLHTSGRGARSMELYGSPRPAVNSRDSAMIQDGDGRQTVTAGSVTIAPDPAVLRSQGVRHP